MCSPCGGCGQNGSSGLDRLSIGADRSPTPMDVRPVDAVAAHPLLATARSRPQLGVVNLLKLPLRQSRSVFNVVVETPKGSTVKLDYDPKHRVFVYRKPLMAGLSYPYDWGFFPGTMADDGDPLDALVLHESQTFPGVVVACHVLGVIRLLEKGPGEKWTRNDRVICCPMAAENRSDGRDLPRELQKELEDFFKRTAELDKKKIDIQGWAGPKAAVALIRKNEK
jgi:inorganic pyrophosphatase